MVQKLNNFYQQSGQQKFYTMTKETLGDGNCFYRAIFDFYSGSFEGKDDCACITHSTFRSRIVKKVEQEFRKVPQSREMKVFVDAFQPDETASTFEEAIKRQRLDGTYATFEFICYAASIFKTAILILMIEDDGNVREVLIPSQLGTERDIDKEFQIVLAHQVKLLSPKMFLLKKWEEKKDRERERERSQY